MTIPVLGTGTTSTANNLITRAMKALGITGATETIAAADANDGLEAFNSLLDSLSNENLMSYVVLERFFILTANQDQYTIGQTGTPDINQSRPLDITAAYLRDSNNNDFAIEILTRDRWNDLGNKTVTSQIPTDLFYDPQFPLGVINLFPIPTLPYTLFYDSTQEQLTFSDLTITISMPRGYERLYVTNLALELMALGYPCLLDDKALMRLINNASEAKANVKRTNIKEVIANMDDAIVSRSNATYNIYRG